MAKRTATRSQRADAAAPPQPRDEGGRHYCSMPVAPEPVLPPDVGGARLEAILVTANKWANGTVLHYTFFDRDDDGQHVVRADGKREWRSWAAPEAERAVVRKGFKQWADLDIGITFKEVATRDEAEIRIGFMQGDGAWSYLGTQILAYGPSQRTMNFGWSLRRQDGLDTAIHEIGHTLGLPHEHQNPNAGIVWNEEAVYAELGGPPNNWDRQKTYYNIIRKLQPDSVQGSSWDPDSIMHYPFDAGLILRPEQYARGIVPAGGLSARDVTWIKTFYPSLKNSRMVLLAPSQSAPLAIKAGEQQNFLIEPPATRRYEARTFGTCDTLMALFEERDGTWRYLAADDDSGEDRNARLRVKLVKGRRYALRVRLKYNDTTTTPAVMYW